MLVELCRETVKFNAQDQPIFHADFLLLDRYDRVYSVTLQNFLILYSQGVPLVFTMYTINFAFVKSLLQAHAIDKHLKYFSYSVERYGIHLQAEHPTCVIVTM